MELHGQTPEQRVTCQVPERVVVALEAVEVEQREHERRRVIRLPQPVLQVEHEAAPVPEPGEHVGQGFLAHLGEQRPPLVERHAHPDDHGQHSPRSEGQGEHVLPLEVVVEEEPEAEQRKDRR
jgi:hypothetical protein